MAIIYAGTRTAKLWRRYGFEEEEAWWAFILVAAAFLGRVVAVTMYKCAWVLEWGCFES